MGIGMDEKGLQAFTEMIEPRIQRVSEAVLDASTPAPVQKGALFTLLGQGRLL